MNDKVKELLKGLGLNAQTIADLADEEKSKDLDVGKVKDATMSNLKERLKNDADFKGEIERGLRAGILGSKESKLLKAFEWLEISDDEIAALPESKKFDALIDLLGTKAAEKKADPATDDATKEKIRKLNEELAEAKGTIKKYKEEIVPEIEGRTEAERQQMKMENYGRRELGKLTLVIDPEFAFDSVNNKIKEQFDVKPGKDGKPKVFEKGTDNEAYNEDNQLVTYEDLLKATADKAKLLKESNGGSGGKRGTGQGDEEEEPQTRERRKTNLPGLNRAEAHAAELKKNKEGAQ